MFSLDRLLNVAENARGAPKRVLLIDINLAESRSSSLLISIESRKEHFEISY